MDGRSPCARAILRSGRRQHDDAVGHVHRRHLPTYPAPTAASTAIPTTVGRLRTHPTAATIRTRRTSRTTTRSSARVVTIRPRPTGRSTHSSATPTTTSRRWITATAGGPPTRATNMVVSRSTAGKAERRSIHTRRIRWLAGTTVARRRSGRGTPSYGGGYAPYSSALYLPSFYTGGQPFSNLYC